MKIKKVVIIIVSVVAIVSIVFFSILGISQGGLFFLAPSYSKLDKYLKGNIDQLTYVVEAFSEIYSENNYDAITVRRDPLREEEKYSMSVRNGLDSEILPIPSELVSHIEALYESGVQVISCGRDDVSFSMWSIMDESRGITYSQTAEQPSGEQLIEVRQLSIKKWYYYVNNFEKAKARNPERFE